MAPKPLKSPLSPLDSNMNVINVHDAKTNFSKLLERVASGARIIIGKAGKPVACLGPFNNTKAVHRLFKGGNLRLQEKAGRPLTLEYLNEISATKYDG